MPPRTCRLLLVMLSVYGSIGWDRSTSAPDPAGICIGCRDCSAWLSLAEAWKVIQLLSAFPKYPKMIAD